MKRFKLYIILFLVSLSLQSIAQDDSEEDVASAESYKKETLEEEKKYLVFKESFIASLAQKGIKNYDKALELLTICESSYPNNVAMLFEKAKNHYKLKQFIETHHYCDKALAIDPNNFWIHSLSRDAYEKEYNYKEALIIQEKLYQTKKSEAQNLLKLYYQTKNFKKGKNLISEIEREGIYVSGITFYKRYFNNKKQVITKTKSQVKPSIEKGVVELKTAFEKNNDYKILRKILIKESHKKEYNDLLVDSETGLSLFPAQAEVYLYKGVALNGLKKYKKAITILEEGLDYLFDKPTILKQFYVSLITAYKATNNKEKTAYYKQLVQKL